MNKKMFIKVTVRMAAVIGTLGTSFASADMLCIVNRKNEAGVDTVVSQTVVKPGIDLRSSGIYQTEDLYVYAAENMKGDLSITYLFKQDTSNAMTTIATDAKQVSSILTGQNIAVQCIKMNQLPRSIGGRTSRLGLDYVSHPGEGGGGSEPTPPPKGGWGCILISCAN